MLKTNEITANLRKNIDSSNKKPVDNVNKRYRVLSMNDSLLNTVVNNSMEEKKYSKEINLNNSKLNIHQNCINNCINSDIKKNKTSSLPSENKSHFKNLNTLSSRNSAGKKYNFTQTHNDIPIPKNKNQSKFNFISKNYNNPNKEISYLLKPNKVNSSILFNVNDNKVKENLNSTNNSNNSNNSNLSDKEKTQENNNHTNSSNNSNHNSNNYKNKTKFNSYRLINSNKSCSKERINKDNNKTKIINHNILENNRTINLSHNNIPNNSFNSQYLKRNSTENLHNSTNNNYYNNNSPRDKNQKIYNLNNSSSSYSINMANLKEINMLKIKNAKLENEQLLLNEKMKSLNQTHIFYSNENDILKSKLTDLQDDYKKDLENMKKYKSEVNQLKILNMKFNQNIKSSINTMLDIIEMFLSPRGNNIKQSLIYNDNNSYSIDIYDSYNNEEERRNIIFDQIQNLLISKFNIMKKVLNVNFDLEIEKVKNWSNALNVNKFNNNDINVSNIKLSVKNYESSSYESSKKNSQDFFDLSISNQFYVKNNSPKFNNSFGIENEATSDKLIKMNNSNKNSSSNIIGINAFNTNNFLSAGNLSLNNLNRIPSTNKNIDNLNSNSANKAKDIINASINNVNYLSLSNMNSNLINNAGKENTTEEKMINLNLNFNESFLKDLNSGQCN